MKFSTFFPPLLVLIDGALIASGALFAAPLISVPSSPTTEESTPLSLSTLQVDVDDEYVGLVKGSIGCQDGGSLSLQTSALSCYVPGTNDFTPCPGVGDYVKQVEFVGRKNDVQQAVRSLVYNPLGGFYGTEDVTITIGHDDDDSVTASTTIFTVVTTSLPSPPAITTLLSTNTITIDEDSQLPLSLLEITVSDADVLGSDTIEKLFTAELISSHGTFSTETFGPVSLAVLNADISAQIFTPHENTNFAVDGVGTLTLTVSDDGAHDDDPGVVSSEPKSTTITFGLVINPVDDDATIADDIGDVFGAEDSDLLVPGLSIVDVDDETIAVSVTIPPSSGGQISFLSTTGLKVVEDDATKTLTIEGSLVHVNKALSTMIFTPPADFHGSLQLTVNCGAASLLKTVTVTPVNDPPDVFVEFDEMHTLEDTPLTILNTAFASVDSHIGLHKVNLEVQPSSAGTISLSSNSGIRFLPDSAPNNLIFNAVESDALTALSGFTFSPSPNFNGLNGGRVEIVIKVDDLSGTSTAVGEGRVGISVAAVNDRPTVSLAASSFETFEDTAYDFPPATFTLNDVDITTLTTSSVLELKLVPSVGTFALPHTAFAGLYVVSNTTQEGIVIRGNLRRLNDALEVATYVPPEHFHGSVLASISLDDLGNVGSGGPLSSVAEISLDVKSQNDVASVHFSSSVVTTDEDTLLSLGDSLVILDNDGASSSGSTTITVSLASSHGTLSAQGVDVHFNVGTPSTPSEVLIFTSTLEGCNNLIKSLVYSPSANYHGDDQLIVTVNDQGVMSESSLNIQVNSVEDPPQIVIKDEALVVTESSRSNVGSSLSLADADGDEDIFTLTVSSSNDDAELTNSKSESFFSVSVSSSSTSSSQLVIRGYVSHINEYISSLFYLASPHGETSDVLTFTLGDSSDNYITSETLPVAVTSAPHTPTISLPPRVTAAEGGGSITIGGVSIMSTILKPTDVVDVTFTVAHGTISLISPGELDDPATVKYSDPLPIVDKSNVSFTATLSALNSILATTEYLPKQHFTTARDGFDFFSVKFSSSKNSREISASGSVVIEVLSSPSAPAVAVSTTNNVNVFTTAEDAPLLIKSFRISGPSPGDDSPLDVKMTVNRGTLALVSYEGLSSEQQQVEPDKVLIIRGAWETINERLAEGGGGLTFTPDPDFYGEDSLAFEIDGVSGGGFDLIISPVNDAPKILPVSKYVEVDEDTELVLEDIELVDVDSDHLNVVIAASDGGEIVFAATAEQTEQLVISSTKESVTLEGPVSALSVLSGVTYAPPADFNTVATSILPTITITARDTQSASASVQETITVMVKSVNDSPVILGSDIPLSGSRGKQTLMRTIAIEDVDAADELVTVTITASSGMISLLSRDGVYVDPPSAAAGSSDAAPEPTSEVTIRGTVQSINDALQPLSYIGAIDAPTTDSLTITASDNEGLETTVILAVAVTAGDSVLDSTSVRISGANDNFLGSFDEDEAISLENLSVQSSVPDAQTTAINLQITATRGSFVVDGDQPSMEHVIYSLGGGGGGGGDDGESTTLILKGLASDLSSAFADGSIVVQPENNFHGAETIVVSINGDQSAQAFNAEILAVNDPPEITFGHLLQVPQNQLTVINTVQVSDVDAQESSCQSGSGNVITLTAALSAHEAVGKISFSESHVGGLQFVTDPILAVSGSSEPITVRGTVHNIDEALGKLNYESSDEFVGEETLTISVSDEGNCGSGGVMTTEESTTFSVYAVNNPPTIHSPGLATNAFATMQSNTSTVLPDIIISDDQTSTKLKVALSVDAGLLTIEDSNVAHLQFLGESSHTSTPSVAFEATPEDASAALSGLVFTPEATHAALTISVYDSGFNFVTVKYRILVQATDEPPQINCPPALFATEDTSTALFEHFTVFDGGSQLTLTLLVNLGTLEVADKHLLSLGVVATAQSDKMLQLNGGHANLNQLFPKIVYTPSPNHHGTGEFALIVADDGAQKTSNKVEVAVTGVIDSPRVVASMPSNAKTFTTVEDTPVLVNGYSIESPDTAASDILFFSLASTHGEISLKSEDGISLEDEGVAVQTIKTSSMTPQAAPSTPEIQVVRTHAAFNYEVQEITLRTNWTSAEGDEVGFTLTHNGMTETAFVNVDDFNDDAQIGRDIQHALSTLSNCGDVSVEFIKSTAVDGNSNDNTYRVTFVTNDGDVPLLAAHASSTTRFSSSEVLKGTTLSEIQRVTLYSDSSIVSGQFQLFVGDQRTAVIDHDSTNAEVKNKIVWLPNVANLAVTVVETNNNYEAGKYRSSWDVEFLQESIDRPLMTAAWNGNGCDDCDAFNDVFTGSFDQVTITSVREGSSPVRGKFLLSFDGQVTSPVDHDVSTMGMRQALESLPNIKALTAVSRSKAVAENSFSWTITFSPTSSPGDLPLIVPAHSVDFNANVYARTVTDGVVPLGGTFSLKCNVGAVACSEDVHVPVSATSAFLSKSLGEIPEIADGYTVAVSSSTNGDNGNTYSVTFVNKETTTTTTTNRLGRGGDWPTLRVDRSTTSLTGNGAMVEILASSESSSSSSSKHKIRSYAVLPPSIPEVQQLVCGTTARNESFYLTFDGIQSAPINTTDYLSPDLLPPCHPTNDPSDDVDSPSPCSGDGSTLKEKLEAMASIASVTVSSTDGNLQVCPTPKLDYSDYTGNMTMKQYYDANAFKTQISFVDAANSGDVMTVSAAPNDGSYVIGHTNVTVTELVKGSAPYKHEVQEITTSATSGSFHLVLEKERTSELNFDASGEDVKAALVDLNAIVDVDVAKMSANTWRVTFTHNFGNIPNIDVLKECDGKPCGMAGGDVTVSKIIDGTAPISGSFKVVLKRLSGGGTSTAQTPTLVTQSTGPISVSATSNELQAALREIPFGANAVVDLSSPSSNLASEYGNVWSFTLNDGTSSTSVSLDTTEVRGHTELQNLCTATSTCSSSCTVSSTDTTLPTLAALCSGSPTGGGDLADYCTAYLPTLTPSQSCSSPTYAGCSACDDNDDYFGMRLLSSRAVVAGSGNLEAINKALSSIVYTPISNTHSAIGGVDEVFVSISDGETAMHSDSFSVFVSNVNDPPGIVDSDDGGDFFTSEDFPLSISTLSFADFDSTNVNDVRLTATIAASDGKLALASASGLTFIPDTTPTTPYAQSTLSFSGTLGNLNNAMKSLSYLPDANHNSGERVSVTKSVKISAEKNREVQLVTISSSLSGFVSGNYSFDFDCAPFADNVAFVGLADKTTDIIPLGTYAHSEPIVVTAFNSSSLEHAVNQMIDYCVSLVQSKIDASYSTSYSLPYKSMRAEVTRRSEDLSTGGSVFEVEFFDSFEGVPLPIVNNVNMTNGASVEFSYGPTGNNVVGGALGLDFTFAGVTTSVVFDPSVTDASSLESMIGINGVSVSKISTSDRQKTAVYTFVITDYCGDAGSETLLVVNELKTSLTGEKVSATITTEPTLSPGTVSSPDTLTITISDGELAATVGKKIYICPVNDAPTISNLPTSTTTIQEDHVYNFPELVSVADIDGDVLALSATSVRGSISIPEIVSGSPTAVTDVLRTAVYTPPQDYEGVEKITLTLTDDKALKTIGIINLMISPVNDPPTISSPLAVLVETNTPTTINGIAVDDVDLADSPDGVLRVTLSIRDRTGGLLTIGNPLKRLKLAAFTVGDGVNDDTMQFLGTVESVNAALADLTYVSLKNFVGEEKIDVKISDGVNDDIATSIDVAVVTSSSAAASPVAINLPSSSTGGVVTIDEDTEWTDNISLDATNGFNQDEIISMSITSIHGSGASEVHVSDTIAQLNEHNSQLRYTPDANYAGVDILTITLTAANGASTTGKVVFNVRPVNDPPTLHVAHEDGSLSAVGNTPLVFPFVEVDDDLHEDADFVAVTVDVSNGGLLSMENVFADPGIIIHSCDETHSFEKRMFFSGTVCFESSPSMASTALSNMQFKADNSDSVETITITVSDGELSASKAIDVDVTPQSLPTKFILQNDFATLDEDSYLIIYPHLQSDGGNSMQTVSIFNTNADAATISIHYEEDNDEGDNNALDVSANPNSIDITAKATSLAALFNSASVRYTPKADFNGYDTVELAVTGNHEPADDGAATINVQVLAVNDSPLLTADDNSAALSGDEGEAVKIANIAVSDVDGDQSFLTALLECEPSAGIFSTFDRHFPGVTATATVASLLSLRGSTSAISSALTSGYVHFIPADDSAGTHIISVTVTDEGGLSDSLSLSVLVNDVYSPPAVAFNTNRIETVEDVDDELSTLAIVVTARDLQPTDPLSCSVTTTEGGKLRFTPHPDVDISTAAAAAAAAAAAGGGGGRGRRF